MKFMLRRSRKTGLPPGTPIYTGEEKPDKVRIMVMDYNKDHFEEKEIFSIEDLSPFRDAGTTTWVNVEGVHKPEVIEEISRKFGWHPLVMEDLVNTEQRPKMENHGDYIYIVFKMLVYDKSTGEVRGEQVSLILGRGYVFSFQEEQGDIFEPVRKRLRNGKTRIREMAPDYLAYALMDVVVDHYFSILEHLGAGIEGLEEDLLAEPSPKDLSRIHRMKREVIFLRRAVWPLRETVSSLEREESLLIHPVTRRYFRDVYDHTIQVIDTVESFRDLLSGMHDTYLSSVSHRMNEIMKVLTIFASIFIPLTFIAGVYGMNFRYMPELDWKWAYPAVWGVMVLVVLGLLIFFKRKKWM